MKKHVPVIEVVRVIYCASDKWLYHNYITRKERAFIFFWWCRPWGELMKKIACLFFSLKGNLGDRFTLKTVALLLLFSFCAVSLLLLLPLVHCPVKWLSISRKNETNSEESTSKIQMLRTWRTIWEKSASLSLERSVKLVVWRWVCRPKVTLQITLVGS